MTAGTVWDAPGITVALATMARMPSGMADTPTLSAALTGYGITAEVVAWDDSGTDWRQFSLVVPHCTWDYLEHRHEFRRWLTICGQCATLPNPLRLLDWTFDKAYLLELAARGIAIPPTARLARGRDADPAALRERFGRVPLVVKPSAGSGGHRVWRCASSDAAADVARTQLPTEGVLIQAFQAGVITGGEYSAVFIEGRLSHAVRKLPKEGDFRVHRRYGATREPVAVQSWMAAYGRRVLSAVPGTPLYARVDFLLRGPADPVLMEVELLEPDLYLRECPGADVRFAAALAARARRADCCSLARMPAAAPVPAPCFWLVGRRAEAECHRPAPGGRTSDPHRAPGRLGDPAGDIQAQAGGTAAGQAALHRVGLVREARPVVGDD